MLPSAARNSSELSPAAAKHLENACSHPLRKLLSCLKSERFHRFLIFGNECHQFPLTGMVVLLPIVGVYHVCPGLFKFRQLFTRANQTRSEQFLPALRQRERFARACPALPGQGSVAWNNSGKARARTALAGIKGYWSYCLGRVAVEGVVNGPPRLVERPPASSYLEPCGSGDDMCAGACPMCGCGAGSHNGQR